VDPRAGLDDVEKRKFLPLPRLELRPLCRPARSQQLYRLSYFGSYTARFLSVNRWGRARNEGVNVAIGNEKLMTNLSTDSSSIAYTGCGQRTF
jgi:hypothetical protein